MDPRVFPPCPALLKVSRNAAGAKQTLQRWMQQRWCRDWRAVLGPFWRGYVQEKEMVQSDQEMEQRRCVGASRRWWLEWRLGFEKKCNQLSSRHRPIWAPCKRRGFGGGLALAPRALTTAGVQVSRRPGWTGGVGAALARAWEATIKAGQTNRWNGRRGSAHRV